MDYIGQEHCLEILLGLFLNHANTCYDGRVLSQYSEVERLFMALGWHICCYREAHCHKWISVENEYGEAVICQNNGPDFSALCCCVVSHSLQLKQ